MKYEKNYCRNWSGYVNIKKHSVGLLRNRAPNIYTIDYKGDEVYKFSKGIINNQIILFL